MTLRAEWFEKLRRKSRQRFFGLNGLSGGTSKLSRPGTARSFPSPPRFSRSAVAHHFFIAPDKSSEDIDTTLRQGVGYAM
jgi:hypothetical protein